MLVGTDVCVPVVYLWKETGELGGNPPVWLGDPMIISYADAGYVLNRVAAVRGEHVTNAPARQLNNNAWSIEQNKGNVNIYL